MSVAVQNPRLLMNPLSRRASSLGSSAGLVDPARDPLNLVVAACLSALIICGIVAARNDMLGWYLLPIFLCGALIGPDMIGWFRGKVDVFDPLGILGAYGYFFFFVAPLLTVMWNYHTLELAEPPNWLGWIGFMSLINVFGLVIYVIGRGIFAVHKPRTVWLVNPPSFFAVISFALPLTLLFQIYIFAKFGGVLQFMAAFSSIESDVFAGMGWQFLIAEMFPIFCAILFLVWKRDFLRSRSWGFLVLLFIAFFALKLLCGRSEERR